LPLGGDLISGNFYVEGRSVAPDFDADKPAVGGDGKFDREAALPGRAERSAIKPIHP